MLRPVGGAAIESLRAGAQATARSVEEFEKAGNWFQAAWHSVSVALFEYRLGNLAEAEAWCRRCIRYPETIAPRLSTARVILSMVSHRAGRAEEARAELAASRELIAAKFKESGDRGTPVQGFWFDWVFARVLLREAETLLGGSTE